MPAVPHDDVDEAYSANPPFRVTFTPTQLCSDFTTFADRHAFGSSVEDHLSRNTVRQHTRRGDRHVHSRRSARHGPRTAAALSVMLIGLGLAGCASRQSAESRLPPSAVPSLAASPIPAASAAPSSVASSSPAIPAVASAALVQSSSAPSQASDDSNLVVTPDSARQAVLAFWPVYTAAFRPVNTTVLARLDEGSAKVADQNAVCGCEPPSAAIVSLELSVPRQTSYPAVFMAELTAGGESSPTLYMLEFRQDSASSPWRLASRVTLWNPTTSAGFGIPVLDGEGYAEPVDSADAAANVALLTQLAQAWQHAKESGDPTTPAAFRSDDWLTGERLGELAQYRQDTETQGMFGHFTFAVDPATPVYQVAVDQRAALVCGAINETTVWTPPTGQVITETYRDPFYSLAPGRYGQVVDRTPWQVCFYAVPGSASSVVYGADGRNFASSTGTLANQ